MKQDNYKPLCERIDALDAQMKHIKQQQDQLTKHRKRIKLLKARKDLNKTLNK